MTAHRILGMTNILTGARHLLIDVPSPAPNNLRYRVTATATAGQVLMALADQGIAEAQANNANHGVRVYRPDSIRSTDPQNIRGLLTKAIHAAQNDQRFR